MRNLMSTICVMNWHYLLISLIVNIHLIYTSSAYGSTFSYTPSVHSPFTSSTKPQTPLDNPANNNDVLASSKQTLPTNSYNLHRIKGLKADDVLLKTHHLKIFYANAQELAQLIFSTNNKNIFTANEPQASSKNQQNKLSDNKQYTPNYSLLSLNGRAIVDERTNQIIVQDTATNIEKIKTLIKAIDIPLAQVVIEANIVLTKESSTKDIGAQWSNTPSDQIFSLGSLGAADNKNLLPSGLMIDYGITSPSNASILHLTLAALEKEGKIKVIAQPKITAETGQQSVISSGTEIPYVMSTTGAVNTLFKKALLSLTVIPRITGASSIMLDIAITQDAVGALYGKIPSIDTNSINTHVLAADGETIVLGGLFTNTQSISTTKVPLLGDIPWIGWLFKSYTTKTDKAELLIFITPKIR
jgi:type IV pilus secretin PilQ/predicted competence protein